MKTVADILGVSSSNLAERLTGKSGSRDISQSRGTPSCWPAIRRLVDAPPPTYRRIAALLNREMRAVDQPAVNCERVHRIIANHAMTLEKHTAVGKDRVRNAKVMVIPSNLPRCSDALSPPAGTAKWAVSLSSSTLLTGRSSRGPPLPTPEFPVLTSATGCWRPSKDASAQPAPRMPASICPTMGAPISGERPGCLLKPSI